MGNIFQGIFNSFFDTILLVVCAITLFCVIVMFIDRTLLKSRISDKLHHRIKIEKTSNIITEIREISQLVCMTYYEEQLGIMELRGDKKYFVQYKNGASSDNDTLIVQYNGKILVGIDLSKIKENDIEINGKSLKAKIPHSEIFEIQINPDDKEYIFKKGVWHGDDETKLYCHMKERLKEHAIAESIFLRSDEIAIKNLTTWFKSFDFDNVEVYMETPKPLEKDGTN